MVLFVMIDRIIRNLNDNRRQRSDGLAMLLLAEENTGSCAGAGNVVTDESNCDST